MRQCHRQTKKAALAHKAEPPAAAPAPAAAPQPAAPPPATVGEMSAEELASFEFKGVRARPRKKIEYAPIKHATYLKPPGSCNSRWGHTSKSVSISVECVEESKVYILDATEQISIAECSKTRCVVGPFALEQADAVREWLNEGAHHAVISLDGAAPLDVSLDAAIARGTTGLPAERLVLLLPVGPLGDPATLATLLQDLEQVAARKGSGCLECAAPETVGAVGGVLLTLAPDAAHEAEEDKLIQAVAPFARCARTLRVAHSARAHARRALCPLAPSAPIAPSAP